MSPVHKSVINYLKYIRPKFAKPEETALFVNPKTGERWTNDDLRRFLSKYGKMVYKPFFPYLMRHWCAIARLIKKKIETGRYDCYTVKNWLGHETISTTEKYIQHAENYFKRAPYDWIKHTLKFNISYMNNIVGESVEKSK